MRSGYVYKSVNSKQNAAGRRQLAGLSGGMTHANLIAAEHYNLRIVGRNPDQGRPAPGVNFSIVVELQTSLAEDNWDMPFWCPNSFVMIWAADRSRILTYKYIKTNLFSDCTGREVLVFPLDFVPDENHKVIFEIYDDDAGSTYEEIWGKEPAVVSRPISLDAGIQQGRDSGIYDDPSGNIISQIGNSFGDGAFAGLDSTLTKILILSGGALGLYFFLPFLPAIKDKFEDTAENYISEERKDKRKERKKKKQQEPDPKSLKGLAKRAGNAAKKEADKALKKIEA